MKSILVALPIVVAAFVVIFYQRSENAKLEEAVTELRHKDAGAKAPRRSSAGPASAEKGRDHDASTPERSRAAYRPGDLRALLAESDPMTRVRALLDFVEGVRTDDIPAVLEELRTGSPEWDPDARMIAHLLLTRWAQEDLDAALASIEAIHFKRGGGKAASIIGSLAAQDPKRAAEWLSDPDNGLAHFSWVGRILAGTIAREWVRRDPDAALEWAAGLRKEQRMGAYSGVLGTLAATDPARASMLAMELEPDEARLHIVGEIAEAWARKSPELALAWAQGLQGSEGQRAINNALGVWAQSDPEAAAGFLDSMPGSEESARYISTLAQTWAQQDPVGAAEWVPQLPEGDGKNEAMGHVMYNWTTRDPESAAAWLTTQPEGPARDNGITGLAKAAFEIDESSALSWAATILNEELRTAVVNIGLQAWRERDAEAAQRWAAANGVPMPAGEEAGKGE